MIYTQFGSEVTITGIVKTDTNGYPVILKVEYKDGDRERDDYPLSRLKADGGIKEIDKAINVLRIGIAKEYFKSEGWEHYLDWQETSPRALEMAISDRVASARHAKVLIDAKFELEEVPADGAI